MTARTLGLWRAALATIGLAHVLASLDTADPRRAPASRRVTGVLIAASGPLHPAVTTLPVPWAETALGATADSDAGPVEIHCVHVPNASNGEVKVRTLQAIRRALQQAPAAARVMCGDLNTPRREMPDGTALSFARDTRGRLRPERSAAWDEAELGVVPGLGDLGHSDTFRSLHGYGAREPSWTWQRISGHGGGWRLDHLFTTRPRCTPPPPATTTSGERSGLSDHSALEADLVAA